jgi:nucleotide-binding universal stress UspA family protein
MVFDSRPILVPLDGSGNAESAVGPAVRLARKLGAPVHFLHVVDPDIFSGDINVEDAELTFANYAKEAVARDGADAVPHTVKVTSGNAAKEVVAASKEAQAVVLATHGRGGFKASLVGSVADKIIRGAEVPTFVVPLGTEIAIGDGPVLIALDGSETAEVGLEAGRELATLFGAKVALVRSYSIPPPVGVEFVAYPVDLSGSLQDGTEAYLKEVGQPGEDVYAVMAPPVDGIEQVADSANASLVVMTSRGKGLASRIALGSVTDRAVHTLKRPILVMPISS